MGLTVEKVLDFLNRNQLRATYRDVAGVLNVLPQALSSLIGPPRPEASWVVNDETGKPSGYTELQCHPNLRSHDVISDKEDLRRRMSLEKKPAREWPPSPRRRAKASP